MDIKDKKNILPSSTNTISTIAFNGISILWVHMQFGPQSAGRLSPLQNCSGLISSYCEMSGAGADRYDISSMSEMTWSPVGATIYFFFKGEKSINYQI